MCVFRMDGDKRHVHKYIYIIGITDKLTEIRLLIKYANVI